jgi:hypothetical protein
MLRVVALLDSLEQREQCEIGVLKSLRNLKAGVSLALLSDEVCVRPNQVTA